MPATPRSGPARSIAITASALTTARRAVLLAAALKGTIHRERDGFRLLAGLDVGTSSAFRRVAAIAANQPLPFTADVKDREITGAESRALNRRPSTPAGPGAERVHRRPQRLACTVYSTVQHATDTG